MDHTEPDDDEYHAADSRVRREAFGMTGVIPVGLSPTVRYQLY